jgi:hypothetical protein
LVPPPCTGGHELCHPESVVKDPQVPPLPLLLVLPLAPLDVLPPLLVLREPPLDVLPPLDVEPPELVEPPLEVDPLWAS